MSVTLALALLGSLSAVPQESDALLHEPLILGPGPWSRVWYTADMHVHSFGCEAPIQSSQALLNEMVASNTHVGNALIWGDSIAVDWHKFIGQPNDPVSTTDNILHWDIEISAFPEAWHGHMMMINVSDPFAVWQAIPRWPGREYLLPNYAWAQSGGGLVGYAHGQFWTPGCFDFSSIDERAPRALALDVALQDVDFLSTEYVEYAGFYWLWYQMLDADFHLTPSAASDYLCLTKNLGRMQTVFPLPANQRLTFSAYVDALRRGATVIRHNTTPPDYLDLRVNNSELGSELALPAGPQLVRVAVEASSARNGAGLEVVINGKVQASLPIDAMRTTYEWTVQLDKSTWIAARIVEPPGPKVRAHTAATVVRLNGCPIRNDPASASNWVTYLDQYATAALASGPLISPSARKQFRAQVQQAKAVWKSIAKGQAAGCAP